MGGSQKRVKVRWLRGEGDHDAHAFRVVKAGMVPSSECGLPRSHGSREDNGPRCSNCRFSLSRNR